jgi:WD40 repeat protein
MTTKIPSLTSRLKFTDDPKPSQGVRYTDCMNSGQASSRLFASLLIGLGFAVSILSSGTAQNNSPKANLVGPNTQAYQLTASIKAPGHAANSMWRNDEFNLHPSLAISPDGRTLASLDGTGRLKIWDAKTGDEQQSLTTNASSLKGFSGPSTILLEVEGQAVSVAAQKLLIPNAPEGTARVRYDLNTKTLSEDPRFRACATKSAISRPVWTCSTDGRYLARLAQWQNAGKAKAVFIEVIDLFSGKQVQTVKVNAEDFNYGAQLLFSPDGQRLALGLQINDEAREVISGAGRGVIRTRVQVFKLKDGALLFETKTPNAWLSWLDNQQLFTDPTRETNEDKLQGLRLWDTSTGLERWRLEPEANVSSPVLHPNGSQIAVIAANSYPELLDLKTREVSFRFGHAISDFAFLPSVPGVPGTIMTASVAGKFRLWNLGDGQERSRLSGVDGEISKLVVSPNGKNLAVIVDGEIRLANISNPSNIAQGLKFTSSLNPKPTPNTGSSTGSNGTGRAVQGFLASELRFSNDGSTLTAIGSVDTANGRFLAASAAWSVMDGKPLGMMRATSESSQAFLTASSSSFLERENSSRPGLKAGETINITRLVLRRFVDGKPVWQGVWRDGYGQPLLVSPDGSVFLRMLERGASAPNAADQWNNQQVDVISTQTGEVRRTFSLRPQLSGNQYADEFAAFELQAISRDNRLLLTAQVSGDGCGGSFGNLQAFDLETAGLELKLPAKLATGYETGTGCTSSQVNPVFAFGPDGQLAVLHDNTIDLWSLSNTR